MEVLYQKKLQCPVCNSNFTSSKVKTSKLRVEKRDTDFLTYYKVENPIKYYVFVCPECGYSAMENFFEKIKPSGKEIIKRNITSKWKKREYSGKRTIEQAIECYKLALYCGQLIGFEKHHLGRICLGLGWLYRLLSNEEEENKFLEYSLNLFREAFYKESLTNSSFDEISLGYLIGELSRRLGNYNDAITWFSNTLSNPLIKTNPRLEKMAREQWHTAKEERNEQ